MPIYKLPESLNKYQSKMKDYFYAYAFGCMDEDDAMWQDLNPIIVMIDQESPCISTLESMITAFLKNKKYSVDYMVGESSIAHAKDFASLKAFMCVTKPSQWNHYTYSIPTRRAVRACRKRIQQIEATAATLLQRYPFGFTVKQAHTSWASSQKWRSYKYTPDQICDAATMFSWLEDHDIPTGYKIVRHRK